MVEDRKIFKTKTGFCEVLPDRIVLTRDGVRGELAEVAFGNSIARPLLIYGMLAAVLFYFAFDEYRSGQFLLALFFAVCGANLVYGIFRSFNNSATPVIERKSIKRVQFVRGIKGLTRSRFAVAFVDANGKVKQRLIMLPGMLADGSDETQKALTIMKEENLLFPT